MKLYENQLADNKKVSLAAIMEALVVDDWDVLYFAKEEQINALIDGGQIDEDFGPRFQNHQEEMRIMMADF